MYFLKKVKENALLYERKHEREGRKGQDPTTAVLMLYTGITWTPPNFAHEPHFVVETAFSPGELIYFTLLLSGFLYQSIKGKQGGIKTFPGLCCLCL